MLTNELVCFITRRDANKIHGFRVEPSKIPVERKGPSHSPFSPLSWPQAAEMSCPLLLRMMAV